VSKKLAGICIIPVKFEIGRQTAAKGAQTLQQVIAPGLTCNTKLLAIGDMDFDLISLLEAKHFDHNGREPDGKAVSPFRDLHGLCSRWIYVKYYVYPDSMEIKDLCGTGTSGASRYPAFPAAPVLLAYSVRNRSASCRIVTEPIVQYLLKAGCASGPFDGRVHIDFPQDYPPSQSLDYNEAGVNAACVVLSAELGIDVYCHSHAD
jgi:hypothetical protein